MVISLTRKIVTATESKAQAYRVGLPRPTCGVYVAYAKNSYRYGIKGTGLSCRATASNLWCLCRLREKSYRYGNKGTGRSCRATAATPPPPPPTHPAAAGSVRVGRGGLRRAGGPCRGGLPRTMPCAARRGAPANRAYAGRRGRSGSGLGRRVRAFPFYLAFVGFWKSACLT